MQEKVKLYIEGMYCAECKDIIAMALRQRAGVLRAEVSYARATAEITYDGALTDTAALIGAVNAAGYAATERRREVVTRQIVSLAAIGALAILFRMIFAHGMMGSTLKEGLTLGMILGIGLTTSIHCLGMCGGILLSQTAKPALPSEDRRSRALIPAASYNGGRILAYTIVGAFCGALGSSLSLRGSMRGLIFLGIGVLMAVVAFQMLNILPRWERSPFRLPSSCALPRGLRRNHAAKPLVIGLLTGLMPCGPLLTMQLYALGSGSAVSGAAALLVFGVGTLPAMLILGCTSAFMTQRFQKIMIRINGVLIAAFSITWMLKGFMMMSTM
jgi:Uncharacterized conserved protein